MQHLITSHYIIFSLHPILTPSIYLMGFIEAYLSYTKKEKEKEGGKEKEGEGEEGGGRRGRERNSTIMPCMGCLFYFPINIRTHWAHDYAAHLLFRPLHGHPCQDAYIPRDRYIDLWI